MKPIKLNTIAAVAALGLVLGVMTIGTVKADSFGSGNNTFSIDFVNVGNAGNADDAGAGGGIYSSPYGGVGYNYQVSTYEISQNDITKATNLGLANVTAGAHTGDEPAANISWYEAAAFVNWLNTSQGNQSAYNLTFSGSWSMTLWGASDQATTGVDSGTNPYRHKDAYYFLPSEDEWYKAAYHQNTGVNADYWDYATGSNTIPTNVVSGTTSGTAVYNGVSSPEPTDPADVTLAGGLSPYGTMGQNGNVWEWSESAFDGINNSASENRPFRGAHWDTTQTENYLRSSYRVSLDPSLEGDILGFRVASVSSIPEPSGVLVVLVAVGAGLLRWRARRSL